MPDTDPLLIDLAKRLAETMFPDWPWHSLTSEDREKAEAIADAALRMAEAMALVARRG
jgi:hypothetical protein